MRAQNIAGKMGEEKEGLEMDKRQEGSKKGSRRGAGSAEEEEDGPQISTGGLIHVDIESVY